MAFAVIARYRRNRVGIGMCAVGPELDGATKVIAYKAMAYARGIAPSYLVHGRETPDNPRYRNSFQVDRFIETEVGYPHPWPRVGHYLANTSPQAIIVEIGAQKTPAYRVLRRTLQHLQDSLND